MVFIKQPMLLMSAMLVPIIPGTIIARAKFETESIMIVMGIRMAIFF